MGEVFFGGGFEGVGIWVLEFGRGKGWIRFYFCGVWRYFLGALGNGEEVSCWIDV